MYSRLCVLFLCCRVVLGLDIYVSNATSNNSTCWNEGGSMLCKTLGWALQQLGLHNHSTVWVPQGSYNLSPLSFEEAGKRGDYRFIWMTDIRISALDNSTVTSKDFNPVSVTVICENETGLAFIYSSSVTIRGIEFFQCGASQYSTSRVSNDMQFITFYTALYFLYSSNIALESVSVTKTPGTGVVFYATVGRNTITGSSFSFNIPKHLTQKTVESGGGGLYIEFPYCAPGLSDEIKNCTLDSNTPESYVSNSVYIIEFSRFFNNSARIEDEVQSIFITPQLDKHLAFGRGGGLSIFFKGYSKNNSIQVRNCTISNNLALWGGGLFIEFQDMSSDNNFTMQASSIENNRCFHHASESKGSGGGGARLGFIYFTPTRVHDNHMIFSDVHFASNVAYYGGGLSFYAARDPTANNASNTLDFHGCSWTSNVARVGSGVDLSVWHPIPYGSIVEPNFSDCNFTSNAAQYTSRLGRFVGIGAFYSDFIPVSFYGEIWFLSNTETALVCIGARLRFRPDSLGFFVENSGRDGGAVALMGYSFVEVSSGTALYFLRNSAEVLGGAIFGQSVGEHDLISSGNCFIRYENIDTKPTDWNSTFFFADNTVGTKPNSIYATSLLTCLWGEASGSASVTEAAQHVFCWNNSLSQERGWIYWNSSCADEIATSPAKFVAENATHNNCAGDRNCNISISVVAGLSTILPFSTKDDRGNNVSNATILTAKVVENSGYNSSSIRIDKTYLYISDNSIELYGMPNSSALVKLETISPRVISTQIRVSFQECPPGMTLDSMQKCVCLGNFRSLVHCHPNLFYSELQRGGWIGFLESGNFSGYVAGTCPYCSQITISRTLKLPQNASDLERTLCNSINRTGALCGKCMDGYGVFVNGFGLQCRLCPPSKDAYNWIFYLMTEFLPITIFFFVVVLFNVSATSGPANAFVFFAQMITTVFKIDEDGSIPLNRITNTSNILTTTLYLIPYDIWNQNFFHPFLPKFCLSSKVSTLQVLSTGFVTAFYPLLLVMIFSGFVWAYGRGFRPVICLCRPVHRCFLRLRSIWNLQRSIVHALATFIILSYTKFTLVSFILLAQTPLLDDDGHTKKRVLYYDGTIEYFGMDHLPYVIASCFVLVTFVALPPIILLLPSLVLCTQRVSRKVFQKDFDIPTCFNSGEFLNAFHGCYKDGTGGSAENSVDCRWFAGYYFILRLLLFSIYAFEPYWSLALVLQQLICIVAVLTLVIFRPYKNQLYNVVDVCIFTNLAALATLSMYNYHLTTIGENLVLWSFVVQQILVFLPLVYMIMYVILLLWRKYAKFVMKKRQSQITEEEESSKFLEYADEEERYRNICGSYQKRVAETSTSPNLSPSGSAVNSSESLLSSSRPTRTSGYGTLRATRTSSKTQPPPTVFSESKRLRNITT